ncbi:poly-beta-1,6-N-acetyl-D-glucosamine biosynthesis protein PgaD [Aquipuribacter sp. SD81]|uniref:poly-beta-1,6-N-acetyl-D-glucosamine biosynthesis protein PgaD n=1 Tax=Aquipuribacter sp. SD81 TaxID=3127703 RepID=UPI00301B653A
MRVLEHVVDRSAERSRRRRVVEGGTTVAAWGLLTLLVASVLDVPALLGVASLPTGRAQLLLVLALGGTGVALCVGLLVWAAWQLHRFRDVERRRRPADVTVEEHAAVAAVDLPTGVDVRLARVAEVELDRVARVHRVVVHELLPADVRPGPAPLPAPRVPTQRRAAADADAGAPQPS